MWITLMGPKHEILDTSFIPPFNAIWVGYSVCKRILSNYLFNLCIKLVLKYSYAEHTHTICTHTWSLRLQIVCLCSAYDSELYEYAGIRVIKNTLTSYRSFTYAEHRLTISMHMLNWPYTYNLYENAQHTLKHLRN